MKPLVRAYLGLGANLGDARATLARAVAVLGGPGAAEVAGVSALYRTRPVGVADQPDFHNAAVALDVPGGDDATSEAVELVAWLKRLERQFGREAGVRWGPRALDLDLLLYGQHAVRVERSDTTRSVAAPPEEVAWLTVPHVSARERLFVLAPLADLAPGLVPPGWGETVEAARARRQAVEGTDAVVRVAEWDRAAGSWSRVER